MEDKKDKSKKVKKLSKTPNIISETGEPIVFEAPMEEPDDSPSSAVDGIPIDEGDIEFRAEDIKKKDDSKLFVKVEGAERIARQKERAAKKKDDELIKRLQTAANERKQQYKNVANQEKAAHRKASKWVRNYKAKKVAKQLWRFRVPIAAAIVIAITVPTVITIRNNIERAAERDRIALELENDQKIIKDNRTDMMSVYAQLVDQEKTKADIETILSNYGGAIVADYFDDTEGLISYKEGSTECITFEVAKSKGKTVVNNYRYHDTINSKAVLIIGASNIFSLSYGESTQKYDNIENLINDYILLKSKDNEGAK